MSIRPDRSSFNWKDPDYSPIYVERNRRLDWLRADPKALDDLKRFYRKHPANFIDDWGMIYEPRNIEIGRAPIFPFLLFDRQWDWADWFLERWFARERGINPKSRDSGISWLAVSMVTTLSLFHNFLAVGMGSYKDEYVDEPGNPKSLFFKSRFFLQYLPQEFRAGWRAERDAPQNRIMIPGTGSIITGEVGDNIGRGGRQSIQLVDESAHLLHPQLVEASLSQTTNCRIDISSANGPANPFAQNYFKWQNTPRVFLFHWTTDPRKDAAWYAKQQEELDPITLAQEVDINFLASVEGLLIPSIWIMSAIDAHLKLGFAATGERSGGLDVADGGKDLNAFCGATGVVIELVEEWPSEQGDIIGTIHRAHGYCDDNDYEGYWYDQDGVGAGGLGDARMINAERQRQGIRQIAVNGWRSGAAVLDPDKEDVKGRKNKDTFVNRKAQAWWELRTRFQKVHRAVTGKATYGADELISIKGDLPKKTKLIQELAQITYKKNLAGKFVIEKSPDGMASPNMGDATMIRFSRKRRGALKITDSLLQRLALSGPSQPAMGIPGVPDY